MWAAWLVATTPDVEAAVNSQSRGVSLEESPCVERKQVVPLPLQRVGVRFQTQGQVETGLRLLWQEFSA